MTQQPNEQQDALVERVARAINEASGSYVVWEHVDTWEKYRLRCLALKVLEAVREGHVVVPRAQLLRCHQAAHAAMTAINDTWKAAEPHGRAGEKDA